jgi:glycosyltransferase involved in cell wall biosynthesis
MNSSDKSTISLSVVITVFSETLSLKETVARVLKNDRDYIKEIILAVSPRSSEECFEVCRTLEKQHTFLKIHVQKNNPGAGWAIREGMQLASFDYIAILSADLETEPEAVDRMVKKIEETGCDLVVGNRWLKGGGFENYDPKKLILNWIFQKAFKILFFTSIGDLTYGYKTIKRETAQKIKWEGTLHEIFIETTIKPIKIGSKVEQIPTVWIGRKEGESKNTFMKNFRYVKLALKVLVQSRKKMLKHIDA